MLLAAAQPSNAVLIVIDVAVVAILLLFLGIGIKKGMMKMGFHLIAAVLSIAIAVFACVPVTNAIAANTTWDDQLGDKLENALVKHIPYPYVEIKYYDHDNDASTDEVLGYEVALENGGVEMRPYDTILDGAGFFSLMKLQNILKTPIEEALAAEAKRLEADTEGNTQVEASVTFVTEVELYFAKLIIVAIAFVVLAIVARILLGVLGYLLDKMVRKLYIAHFVNSLLGAVFGLACGAVLLLVCITVLQLMQTLPFMEDVNNYLAGTKIVSFVMEKNVVYDWLASLLKLNG